MSPETLDYVIKAFAVLGLGTAGWYVKTQLTYAVRGRKAFADAEENTKPKKED